MTNRGATGSYLQGAFLQAEGELYLEVSSQPKTAAEMPQKAEKLTILSFMGVPTLLRFPIEAA